MDKWKIAKHIDHTDLRATATWEDIQKLCCEALKYKTASVCIPPFYVKIAKMKYPELTICTVVGFPLGYQTTGCKVFEAEEAIQNGADEIDMVIHSGKVKNKDYSYIADEIGKMREVCKNKVLKVIVETCYLDENEIRELCICVSQAKADYIKTSTGFGTRGASINDIRLFKKYLSSNIKIKASGGIRTKEQMQEYIHEGCERLGSSLGISALFEKESN
ncbi:deoxyribose-phosphate aldolase [Traorella massiliensis]|uniref:deoxyribose-phosphate aldolase n=1 Tax=Traorella massiliensis TaxID=1903263 RepID=UPI0023520CF2|nr:deoxyribose-phosphate aldolase [Traorella massiliensis]